MTSPEKCPDCGSIDRKVRLSICGVNPPNRWHFRTAPATSPLDRLAKAEMEEGIYDREPTSPEPAEITSPILRTSCGDSAPGGEPVAETTKLITLNVTAKELLEENADLRRQVLALEKDREQLVDEAREYLRQLQEARERIAQLEEALRTERESCARRCEKLIEAMHYAGIEGEHDSKVWIAACEHMAAALRGGDKA